MKKLSRLLTYLFIMIGVKPAPMPQGARIIFLRDGRKVIAPAKPEKLSVQYSIVPEPNMDYSQWFEYIRLGGNDTECLTIRKWYL